MKSLLSLALVLFISITSSAFDGVEILSGGHYPVIEINNRHVIIEGNVTAGNININGAGSLTIWSTGSLKLSSSLHLNGNFKVTNDGILEVNNLELQNGNNTFINNSVFSGNVGRINSCTDVIRNNGTMTLNSFQANCGKIYLGECSLFATKHLDINTYKPFIGGGFLRVQFSGNFNYPISEGNYFYYPYALPANITESMFLVPAHHKCTPLAVKLEYFQVKGNKLEWKGSEGVYTLQISKDGKSWKDVGTYTNQSEEKVALNLNYYRLKLDDGEITYSKIISAYGGTIEWWDMTGRPLSSPQQGYYIESQGGVRKKVYQY